MQRTLLHWAVSGNPGLPFALNSLNVNYKESDEYHQVKRQQTSIGRWILGDLERKGVLSYFWQKLQKEPCKCVFASTHSAHQLEELASRARGSLSWVEFDQVFLKGEHREAFENLQGIWNARPEAAY